MPGLLSDNYYDEALQKRRENTINAKTPQQEEKVTPREVNNQEPSPVADFVDRTDPLTAPTVPVSEKQQPFELLRGEQSQINKFGGEVGSSAYYRYKAEHPYRSFLPQQIGSSFGLQFPSQEVWDSMRIDQRALWTTTQIPLAAGRLVKELPKEILKTPIRLGASIIAPWKDLAQGKPATIESVSKQDTIDVPLLGEVGTYYNTYEDARQSGSGKFLSFIQAASLAAGDVAIVGSLVEAGVSAATRPRGKIKPNTTQVVRSTEPIKNALLEDGKAASKINSTSEYYTLPKTVAKEAGGNSGNTFLKVTPAGETSIELSIVKNRSGLIPGTVDYVKGKIGIPEKTYQGAFGKEVKIQSQIIDVGRPIIEKTKELSKESVLKQIPPKPLKGFERSFITEQQVSHLSDIGRVNGINPSVKDAVVRTITGKKVVGELTQSEYVNVAQTLAKFNNVSKYAPEASQNAFTRFFSPQRHWMRAFEEKGGMPIYSEIYVPMEEAIRLRNVFRSAKRAEARDLFGKYAKGGFGEERRLITEYLQGNKNAITGNPALNIETKQDLVKIADQLRKMYDDVGQQLDVPAEIFLKDYQPHIQNIGGVHQLYKEGVTEIPKEINFFAKFKRTGGVGVAQDDALALWDIYTNAGSNRVFLNPVLDRASKLSTQLPETIHNSVRSYVLERMGYAGNIERGLNEVGKRINKKLGTNIPEDAARQFTQLAMDTTYSGALGANPGKAARNLLQTDLMTYPRLGPKFYGDAARAALDPRWHAEVRSRGFLVELGVPFGEELSKDITLFGRAGNTYRKVTQGTLGPYSMADQVNRVRTYAQLKMQFDDALLRYNNGKITWPQLEKELDFASYGKSNIKIIRERMAKGDTTGAFENMVREVLDETHFPYRRGSSSRITYGLGGKIGTQFAQWPIEFVHTHARWLRTGQYDKLIRFWAASSAIKRSFNEALNVDTERFVFYNPVTPSFSPAVRSGIDIVEGLNALISKNAEQLEENKEDLIRATTNLLIPGGAQAENVRDFFKSYNNGPIGPNGQYGVYDSQGRLKYYATFSELWTELWGFPSKKGQEFNRLNNEIRNAQFDRAQAKKDVLELYQQEKYDEANKIILEYGIEINPSDFDKYHIPLQQRTFQQLPDILKSRFGPKIFKTE